MIQRLVWGARVAGDASLEAARRTRRMAIALLHAFVFAMIALVGSSWWQRHVEATWPIYGPVEYAQVVKGADTVIWTGVSRKLQPCTVVAGSLVMLTAYWEDDEGRSHPLSYAATRPGGAAVPGAPLITKGGEFVVGPWLIRDKPEIIARVVRVSQFLHCMFPSGIERRDAEIGPVEGD